MRSMILAGLGALVSLLPPAPPPPAPPKSQRWVRANFHAHTRSGPLRDDGAEEPRALHAALRAAGVELSVHTPHSTLNRGREGALRAQRALEEGLALPGLTVAVGEELTVAPGPRFQAETAVMGHAAPGNLNHLSLFGMRGFVPSETSLARACEQVHREGGVCIVNHPGPGPLMWEPGLWESQGARVDALEVYNGQALAAAGLHFEARYLQATAYSGLGLRLAAVTGADTHGPQAVAVARARLRPYESVLALLGLEAPTTGTARPELLAQTLVAAARASEAEVAAALRARRTVALYGLGDLTVEVPGLGEVRRGARAVLRLRLSRALAEVTLYREGQVVRTWQRAAEVTHEEAVSRPCAYVFGARDGAGRLLTSALWYEP